MGVSTSLMFEQLGKVIGLVVRRPEFSILTNSPVNCMTLERSLPFVKQFTLPLLPTPQGHLDAFKGGHCILFSSESSIIMSCIIKKKPGSPS